MRALILYDERIARQELRRVVAVTPEADGYTISLRGGPDVVVSRRQAKLLRDLLAL